jgi:hypothetical protein
MKCPFAAVMKNLRPDDESTSEESDNDCVDEGGEVGGGVAGLGAMASLMGPELSESAF